jgi:hypothetical protein
MKAEKIANWQNTKRYVISDISVTGVCWDGTYSSGRPYIEFSTLTGLVEFWEDLRKLDWTEPTPEHYEGMLTVHIKDIPLKHRSKFEPDVLYVHVWNVEQQEAHHLGVLLKTVEFEPVSERTIKITTTLTS